ncbi:hypothetical protein [Corynebacterium auris]|uniref:hypothetical protein n=1 Tax=Corynebacterium auris TaxID=44750 RepID=UPI0025B603C6|nr:hypothetical protein [Corynebacterium auris]WJY67736.1 hypothetical protein CAURIS_04100 [Corynebacterium auris]
MHNDPAKPGYSSKDSTNKPVDRDDDQLAQDTGSHLGYGEEAPESVDESQRGDN